METEIIKIEDLTPYEKNARKHNAQDIDAIAKSIEAFGFRDPVGVWGPKNLIVEGHGRVMAAKQLGLTAVPCIRLDDLTDEQCRAYALAHNKTAELSTWDAELLPLEIEELPTYDMTEFGFSADYAKPQAPDPVAQEDDFDEDAEDIESRVKPGDLWDLGGCHRLLCGDSTDPVAVDRLMGGDKAELVFTDPPYNVASDSKNFAADCSKAMEKLSRAEWDHDFDIAGALDSIMRVLAKDASVYICTSHFLAGRIWTWMKAWADHNLYCVWSKPNPMPSLSKRHWTWNTELICYATRGKHVFNFPAEGHALSTWTIPKVNGKTGHPTEKPVSVPSMAVEHSSREGGVVLDLFGGSGSTLVACEQLNRRCRMMELDPHYCDVIISRWEKLTGKKAEIMKK